MTAEENPSKTVLLLRSPSDSPGKVDKYLELAKYDQIQVFNLPVLTFNFINGNELIKELNNCENYEAIVFTSPRAVEAIEAVMVDTIDFEENWTKNKVCYVVGEETASRVKSSLEWKTENIIGSEAGNALNLAEVIISRYEEQPKINPLFFPCGNLKRNELEQTLIKQNIQLQPLTVYETCTRKDIPKAIEELQFVSLDFVVFFSPSGVKNVYDLLKETVKGFEESTKVIAIGPTTANTLKSGFGCQNVFIAENPSAESVMNIISQNLL